jgi:adenosylhomocysteine nucleosidase
LKLLVITPIEAEMDALSGVLRELGGEDEQVPVGRATARSFYQGSVLLLQGGLGKAEFGVRTQHALDTLRGVGGVVCAGVAGALDETLAVGDVVVATATAEHDFNWPRGERPRFEGHGPFIDAIKDANVQTEGDFAIHFGPIASGDEGINDIVRAREIREGTGALAVAWEGAGGARAGRFSEVPFLEVRGISDLADSDANSEWRGNIPRAMRNVADVLDALVRWVAGEGTA